MTNNDLTNSYFNWMYDLVCYEPYFQRKSYRKLFEKLYDTPFTYIIPMDGNREADGFNLRYRFGDERHYPHFVITANLDNRPCSVLEMMIALAIRCEEHIMDDPDIGNRTGNWFWDMISSLGLKDMDDLYFDPDYVDKVIQRFLDRKYKRNGEGGLFTVNHRKEDLRYVEIWYQMMWYLCGIA